MHCSHSEFFFSPVIFPQASLQVIAEDECQLWWAGKELRRGKKLQEFVGKNEKTKLVVKISKVLSISAEVDTCEIRQDLPSVTVESVSASFQKGQGAPAREPLITDAQQQQMMMRYHKRQEELKVRRRLDQPMKTLDVIFHLLSVHLPDYFYAIFQKLEEADDDSYLDSQWADRQALRKQFQGLTNIKWGPR